LPTRYILLLRWAMLSGLLLLVIGVAADVIGNPGVVQTGGSATGIYLALFVLAILIYSWFALFRTPRAAPAQRLALRIGTRWGLVCGGAWLVEVLIANVIGSQLGPLHIPLYYLATMIGFLLPVLAGMLAAQCSGRRAGLEAGLLCGMLGGLILCAVATVVPAIIMGVQPDAQTLDEFHRSGLVDLQTFLIGDFLAALIAHLWIGLITGLLFGLAGAAVGKALAGRRATA
jgi:hypothetical protein